MHPKLKTRRRIVIRANLAYMRADYALRQALNDARKVMPDVKSHNVWRIGHPGSQIRKLYDERHRAIERLQVAHLKLELARARVSTR